MKIYMKCKVPARHQRNNNNVNELVSRIMVQMLSSYSNKHHRISQYRVYGQNAEFLEQQTPQKRPHRNTSNTNHNNSEKSGV